MAQVYLARENAPNGRVVALKQILPHLVNDTGFIAMFLDEARIAARLHHPNVVEIYDLGREGEAFFIAMEYIHGEDLRKIEKRAAELGHTVPLALCCRIVREAARGLDYAHKRADAQGKSLSIVHRDVSPQNILVGFDGAVKVADFGVAKAADKATITASGVIKGKHPYMSPEQALGMEDLDHRTDVFALGVVLYEAVTGVRLFRRATDLQTLQAVAECTVVPPSKVAAAIPLQLDDVLMTALTRERERRFASCAELGAALDAVLAALPESSSHDVARFVSELFADRLMREARSGAVATFGVAGAAPPPAPRVTAQPDTAKTIELMASDPSALPLIANPLARAEPLPTVEMRAGLPSKVVTDPHSPGPFSAPGEQPPPTLEGTVPFGKAPRSGTQAYGRPVVQTVTSLAGSEDAPTVDERATAPEHLKALRLLSATPSPAPKPTRGSWRWPLIVAGAAVLAPAGWFAATTLRAPPRVVAMPAPVAPAAPVPVPVPVAAPPRPTVRAPQGVATGCTAVFPIAMLNGRMFVRGADPETFKSGTAFRMVGDGDETRNFYGMAMVVELRDHDARLIADEPERLPETLFACAVEEDLPLKGTLHARANGTTFGVQNATDLEWTGCELFLPNNTQARLPARALLKPGKLTWVTGVHAAARRVGAEPKVKGTAARIRCAEGDGELPVVDEH